MKGIRFWKESIDGVLAYLPMKKSKYADKLIN